MAITIAIATVVFSKTGNKRLFINQTMLAVIINGKELVKLPDFISILKIVISLTNFFKTKFQIILSFS